MMNPNWKAPAGSSSKLSAMTPGSVTPPGFARRVNMSMTLEPGDLISTGTPGKLGPRREPPVFMQPGDQVRVRIEGIGELANPIVAEAALN